ncbi:enoyl-ACP reductase FabI [Streptomyces sp. NPDC001393]
MTGVLAGKRILVTGVLTESSIAFAVARRAQEEGAEVLLSSYGRAGRITRYVAERLPAKAPVIELDVTSEADLAALPERVGAYHPQLDGVLHAIAFAPQSALGGEFLNTPWPDVATAVHVSAYSLKALARACLPVLARPASVVGLDFDASLAWPGYDWMGVAKAALESVTRYLTRDLGPCGVRVNLVAAGPLRTQAATSIPGFARFESAWRERAPLGWDVTDAEPAARACVALLSDWFPSTSGEIVHVDGGFHAVGT